MSKENYGALYLIVIKFVRMNVLVMCHQIFASDTVVAMFTLFWVCVFKRRSSLGSTGTEYKIYVKNVVMF